MINYSYYLYNIANQTLTNSIIAIINEPNATVPKWYLKNLLIAVGKGIGPPSYALGPYWKYHTQTDPAIINSTDATIKDEFHNNPNKWILANIF